MFTISKNSVWSEGDYPFFRIYKKDLQISYWCNEICVNKITQLEKRNNKDNVKYCV